MSDGVDIKISEGLIKPVVEARIQAAIVQNIGGGSEEALIALLVKAVTEQKVDEDGGPHRYGNQYTALEVIARKAITAAVREAVEQWVKDEAPAIRAAVDAELRRKKNGLAKLMVDGLGDSLKNAWNLAVTCKFSGPRGDY